MVPEHAEALSKVAQERKEVFIFQNVNKDQKIAEGAVPKPMGIKPKTGAVTGEPAAGYIPVNQALSKAADTNEVEKYNKLVDEAIKKGDAIVVQVKTPTGEVAVLADPKTGRPFTSDYDVLMIGREKPAGEAVSAGSQGMMAPEDKDTFSDMNEAVNNSEVPPADDVAPHGAASNAPVAQPINYPVTVMDSNGDIISCANQQELQKVLDGSQAVFQPDPAWGLK